MEADRNPYDSKPEMPCRHARTDKDGVNCQDRCRLVNFAFGSISKGAVLLLVQAKQAPVQGRLCQPEQGAADGLHRTRARRTPEHGSGGHKHGG
ncbi:MULTISPECIES: hypothetical protein [unclassified Methanoculleus]|mgnify:CR=1 FL=1|jgi:hypothetical protein|uniref:Uncharacterized protein n=1 Tax=Methanoculleus palmolei TaxID=72612 RepID=A0ABD8A816_9EURY|nr:hypothetical protein [Methanoculleus sp. UBA377]WOX55666.1 hypothetical protein R6Y95_09365 [Methanoculleus palmolei]